MRKTSNIGSDIRGAVENLRDAVMSSDFGRWTSKVTNDLAHRDIRDEILTAMGDKPLNGQEIMQAISENNDGWMPSASHVYPMLTLLTDEGLLTAKVKGERTVYALTDAGREAATVAASATGATDEQSTSARSSRTNFMRGWKMPSWDDATGAMPKASVKLAQAAAQVAQTGTREQKERAAALLDETRRKLYAMLAED
jgi:DNA-binding PadR family transcriptional regulator